MLLGSCRARVPRPAALVGHNVNDGMCVCTYLREVHQWRTRFPYIHSRQGRDKSKASAMQRRGQRTWYPLLGRNGERERTRKQNVARHDVVTHHGNENPDARLPPDPVIDAVESGRKKTANMQGRGSRGRGSAE